MFPCHLLLVSLLLMLPLSSQAQNASPAPVSPPAPLKVRLMTWNIRYANKGDEAAGHGWPQRRTRVFDLIKGNSPDVLCVQEAVASQMDDLAQALPDYDHFGVGRDDAKRAGEFAAVFYKRDRFERVESQTVWLSETPDVPSKGWDAVLPRIATRVRLRDRASDTKFDAWSTHFDHMGVKARLESAHLLRARVAASTVPSLVAGDLNTIPSQQGYKTMVAQNALRDARSASESAATGPGGTFCGWNQPVKAADTIDYVFVSGTVRVERFDVSTRGYETFPNPSDHLPIIVDLLVPTTPR